MSVRATLLFPSLCLVAALAACGGAADGPKGASRLLEDHAKATVPAWQQWKRAAWRAHTEVVDGDPRRADEAASAAQAWRAKAADPRWARDARDVLQAVDAALAPNPAERAAIDAIRRTVRRFPATDPALLAERDTLEAAHLRLRMRTRPSIDGEIVDPAAAARAYADAVDLTARVSLWKSLMDPAGRLRPSFLGLRAVRNQVARKGGWPDHLVAESDVYGLDEEAVRSLTVSVERALRPLFLELHTWARHELAAGLQTDVPELLPAHWLPTPLGQDWSNLVAVEDTDLGPGLAARGAPSMLRAIDTLYVGVGMSALSPSFWERSSLYPAEVSVGLGKTRAPSAWDLDLTGDVRVLLSATATPEAYHQAVREFGFAHALAARTEAGLPYAVRQQEPRALVGAVGAWGGLIASRPGYLAAEGYVAEPRTDMPALLAEALVYVPWLRFTANVVVPWELALYADDLPEGRVNDAFWQRMRTGLGVTPPEARTERHADALYQGTVHDLPGRSIDPLLSTLIAFQVHMAIAERLGVDPRSDSLAGRPEVGAAMTRLATSEGMTELRAVVTDLTGAGPSADAVAAYFEPLREWLQEQNVGRSVTLPPAPD